jgi:hypothetical protein
VAERRPSPFLGGVYGLAEEGWRGEPTQTFFILKIKSPSPAKKMVWKGQRVS